MSVAGIANYTAGFWDCWNNFVGNKKNGGKIKNIYSFQGNEEIS